MQKYKRILEILYKHISAQELLENEEEGIEFEQKTFEILANVYMPYLSNNEANNLYSYLVNHIKEAKHRLFGTDNYQQRNKYSAPRKLNVFDVLLVFDDIVLQENGGEPICKYLQFLLWRSISYKLDEELFVTSYLAYRDIYRKDALRDFRWDIVLGTDNVSMQQLLESGIAENHFHLKGSAPYFHLSWLAMMNNISSPKYKDILINYDKRRLSGNISYNPEFQEQPLYVMYRQAALIRLILFIKLKNRETFFGKGSIHYNIVKNNLNYEALAGLRLKKEEILKACEKKYTFYNEIKLIAVIYQKEEENENEEGKEYRLNFIKQVLCNQYFKKTEIELWNNEFTLADIAVKVFGKNFSIPVISLKGLIDQKLYEDISEANQLEFVYSLLRNPDLMELYLTDIQDLIIVEQNYLYEKTGDEILADYAIPEYIASLSDKKNARGILTGERWLMYTMFQKIYNKVNKFEKYFKLFYIYIIIKENIRSELIQVNSKVGFDNFSIYESRKEDFVEDTPFMERRVKRTDSILADGIRPFY